MNGQTLTFAGFAATPLMAVLALQACSSDPTLAEATCGMACGQAGSSGSVGGMAMGGQHAGAAGTNAGGASGGGMTAQGGTNAGGIGGQNVGGTNAGGANTGGANDGGANTGGGMVAQGGGSTTNMVPDFSLLDVNTTSPTTGMAVSPRDYLMQVSAWYFAHAT